MKKLLSVFLLVCVVLIAGDLFPPRERVGQPQSYLSTLSSVNNEWNRNWETPSYIYAFNTYTDTLKVGHVICWNNTLTLVVDSVARASACDTMILADSLKYFHWSEVRLLWNNAVTACTVDIRGLDTVNVAQAETLVITGARAFQYSTKSWRKINLIIWRNAVANDSLCVWGIPYMGVNVTTDADDIDVCGVVAEQSLTDSIVKIQTRGLTKAYLKGASVEIFPGMAIQTSTTAGYGAADATEVTGAGLGKAMSSGNTDGLYWIQIDLQ